MDYRPPLQLQWEVEEHRFHLQSLHKSQEGLVSLVGHLLVYEVVHSPDVAVLKATLPSQTLPLLLLLPRPQPYQDHMTNQ